MNLYRCHAAATVLYALAAWAVICHGQSLTHAIWGQGTDPLASIWFLAWWPYALAHHVSPFYTALVWQPVGVNLAWAGSVPALAKLALPVTVLAGPVVALNLLTLAGPFGAACAAYALCFYLTRRPLPALFGGYLFGFAPYEMAQATEHLNLDFTVCVPLLVLLALVRLDKGVSRVWFAVLGALLLACQFAISIEVTATGLLFGGMAWALAYGAFPARRPALARLVIDSLCAAPLAAVLLSPMLWVMFTYPHDISLPKLWPEFLSTDPLNLVLPTSVTAIGAGLARPVTSHFAGFSAEQDGYLGLPWLAILWLYGRAHARFAGALLVIIVVLSFGPILWLDGTPTAIPLPWALFWHLPLLSGALPARFMLFATLGAAVLASLWLAAGPSDRGRLVLAALAAAAILPAPQQGQAVPASSFFAPGQVQAALGPNPILLLLPFGVHGTSAYWQAESGFSFTQTAGYLGFPPGWAQPDGALMQFYFRMKPGLSSDFAAYCVRTRTQFVVAGPGTPADQLAALYRLGWPARTVDDAVIFTVPHG